MLKPNEYVVYKNDTCLIKEIINNNGQDYYVLLPLVDPSLKVEVPVDNDRGNIKPIISKKEVEELINDIPNIPIITSDNDKMIDQEYKRLLSEGDHRDLIGIIKTTYARNAKRVADKKKIGEKDDAYFKKVEKILYNELSIALGLSYDDTKIYVENKVKDLLDKE